VITFLFTCALLVPLGWFVLSGPQPALFQIAGGVGALVWLAAKGQLLALLQLLPFLAAGIVYAVAGYIVADRADLVMYSYQMALLLLFYGLPAGLCLRRLAEGEQGDKVAWALVVFAICMAAVSLIILRTPEVQRITGETAGTFQRTNGESSDVVVYLRYFKITNIIIGVIPFTLFALAALPVALVARSWALRLLACVAVGVAVYANVLIATRTALMAATLSSVAVLLFAFPHVPKRRWLSFAGAIAVTAAVVGIYFGRHAERFSYLLERFAEAGDDGRLGIWSEALGLVERFPYGQVAGRMQSHSWAHNLFLDVGLTNGWIAIAAVLAMFVCAYYYAGQRLLVSGFFNSATNVIMLTWLISTSIAAMIQPPQPVFLTVLHLAFAYFAPYRPTREETPAGWLSSRPAQSIALEGSA
jgi:hypothetical protein